MYFELVNGEPRFLSDAFVAGILGTTTPSLKLLDSHGITLAFADKQPDYDPARQRLVRAWPPEQKHGKWYYPWRVEDLPEENQAKAQEELARAAASYFRQAAAEVIFDPSVTESFPNVKRLLVETDAELEGGGGYKAADADEKTRLLAAAVLTKLR